MYDAFPFDRSTTALLSSFSPSPSPEQKGLERQVTRRRVTAEEDREVEARPGALAIQDNPMGLRPLR